MPYGIRATCEMVISLLRCDVASQGVPFSPLNIKVLQLLQANGYIRGFLHQNQRLEVLLKYFKGAPVIRDVNVVSRPSRSMYLTNRELVDKTRYNAGTWIIDNNNHIMTHREAIRRREGGRVLLGINTGFQTW